MSMIKSYYKGLQAGGFRSFKGLEEAQAALEDILDMIGQKMRETTQLLGRHTTNSSGEEVMASGWREARDTVMQKLNKDDADLVRLKDLLYQQQNGGFAQWVDNGYASADIGRLIKILGQFGPPGQAAVEILQYVNQYVKKTGKWNDKQAGFYSGRQPSVTGWDWRNADQKFNALRSDLIIGIAEYYLGDVETFID